MREIEDAYNACIKNGNHKVVILECTSSYPAPSHAINLRAIKTIEDRLKVVTGFSDHTMGTHIAVGAVAAGAKVIEKHFTLNRKLKGPDHPFAAEPRELALMVKHIRELENALGSGKKKGPAAEEKEYYKKARRSIHARAAIHKGDPIMPESLIVKRPGYGIKPRQIKQLIGKKARRTIKEDEWITWKMVF